MELVYLSLGSLLALVLCIFYLLVPIRWRELWFVIIPAHDPKMAELKLDILKIWKIRTRNSWTKFKHDLYWKLFDLKITIKSLPGKLKRRIWNKHLLLTWHRLWIRKDEFHASLNMDPEAMWEMDEKERDSYIDDLIHRRKLAHKRDLDRKNAKLIA